MSDRPEHLDDDLAELRAIGGRVGAEPVAWEAPPADLWARIAAEAGVDAGVDPVRPLPDPTSPFVEPARSTEPERLEPVAAAGGGGVVTPLRPRRQVPWFLAAAAALVVVAGIVAVGLRGGDGSDESVIASSTLDRLDLAPDGAQGSAELVDVDGQLSLRLDVDGLVQDDGFLEVWVIDTEVSQLVSLGPIRSDGLYDLPAGIDPEAFPIVDVSVEPLDGDPTHSGQSVLRGQLTF